MHRKTFFALHSDYLLSMIENSTMKEHLPLYEDSIESKNAQIQALKEQIDALNKQNQSDREMRQTQEERIQSLMQENETLRQHVGMRPILVDQGNLDVFSKRTFIMGSFLSRIFSSGHNTDSPLKHNSFSEFRAVRNFSTW